MVWKFARWRGKPRASKVRSRSTSARKAHCTSSRSIQSSSGMSWIIGRTPLNFGWLEAFEGCAVGGGLEVDPADDAQDMRRRVGDAQHVFGLLDRGGGLHENGAGDAVGVEVGLEVGRAVGARQDRGRPWASSRNRRARGSSSAGVRRSASVSPCDVAARRLGRGRPVGKSGEGGCEIPDCADGPVSGILAAFRTSSFGRIS
jgi:hypothetical protein